jgi:hypothetical protein
MEELESVPTITLAEFKKIISPFGKKEFVEGEATPPIKKNYYLTISKKLRVFIEVGMVMYSTPDLSKAYMVCNLTQI